MAKKKHKKQESRVGRCDYCKKPLDPDPDAETTYKMVFPKGQSREVLGEALERARLAEEANPTPPGLERDNYQLAAYIVKRGRDGKDGDYSDSFDNIVFGRFAQDVGGHLLAMHPECAERTADAGNFYETPGWGD